MIPEPVVTEHRIKGYKFTPHVLARLVHGSQVRVHYREHETHSRIKATVPATPWDALKLLLVQWQPTLDFGWFRPKTRSIITKQYYSVEEEYINVIPAPPDSMRSQVWRITHLDALPLTSIDQAQWLIGEPCTKHEINKARDDYYKALTSERAAWMMGWRACQ